MKTFVSIIAISIAIMSMVIIFYLVGPASNYAIWKYLPIEIQSSPMSDLLPQFIVVIFAIFMSLVGLLLGRLGSSKKESNSSQSSSNFGTYSGGSYPSNSSFNSLGQQQSDKKIRRSS